MPCTGSSPDGLQEQALVAHREVALTSGTPSQAREVGVLEVGLAEGPGVSSTPRAAPPPATCARRRVDRVEQPPVALASAAPCSSRKASGNWREIT